MFFFSILDVLRCSSLRLCFVAQQPFHSPNHILCVFMERTYLCVCMCAAMAHLLYMATEPLNTQTVDSEQILYILLVSYIICFLAQRLVQCQIQFLFCRNLTNAIFCCRVKYICSIDQSDFCQLFDCLCLAIMRTE